MRDNTGTTRSKLTPFGGTGVWSLGITRGNSLEELGDSSNQTKILDAKSMISFNGYAGADPFGIQIGNRWFVFFEMFIASSKNAVIAVAESSNLETWTMLGVALKEMHHLSFPHVFEHQGEIYMMPESKAVRVVNLYRAIDFPMRWERVNTVLRGRFMDASTVFHNGRYWLFTGWRSYSLRIFHSSSPLGPWKPHFLPLARIYSKQTVRPGGRPIQVGTSLVRFAQDNRKFYGHQLIAMRISCLNRIWYSETPHLETPILSPSGSGWNGRGMHHLDLHTESNGKLIAFIDGFN